MSSELYEDLWWWWNNRPIRNSPCVFPSTHPLYYGGPYTSRHHFLKTLCSRAGVKPFGFHALRRYVASVLADTHKVSAKNIQRILRHKNLCTTERYIKKINQDLEATVNLLSRKSSHEGLPGVIEETPDS
jgi:integrase